MFSSIVAVAGRELKRIVRSKTLSLLTIGVPFFLLLFLPYLYRNRVVTDIPIAICDQDHSATSRALIRSFEATRSLKIAAYVASADEIRRRMIDGSIRSAVFIPAGLEKNLKNGKPSTVVIFKDSGNLVIGNLILKEALQITQTFSAGILLKKFRSSGMDPDQALNLANPIRVETQSLANPAYNYQIYMMSGLLPFMLQLAMIVAAVLVINGEYRDGTIGELFRISSGAVIPIIAGKMIAHVAIQAINILVMLALIFPFFDIDIPGSAGAAYLFLVFFIMVTFSLGLLISSLFRDQMFATEVASFITIPSFIFSGFTFPLWGMPDLHSSYAQLLPFTHFMSGFLKVYYLGSPLRHLWPEFVALTVFFAISLGGAVIMLRRMRLGEPAGYTVGEAHS